MDTNIRICGEAGQGVQSTGDLLTKAFHSIGLHVYATQDYMSRIRGGVNSCDIRISGEELFGPRSGADVIVALSAEALAAHRDCLSERGVIIHGGGDGARELAIRFEDEAKAAGGSARTANSVAAGAVFTLLGYDAETLCSLLRAKYERKGGGLAEANEASARRGAELAESRRGSVSAPQPGAPRGEIVSGSHAIALAAARAGVRVVSCYPMTPSTGIFTSLAEISGEYGIAVEQAEDEICAINLVCGAAYAGAPALTATSGGGFALMVEGLSLAGMLELPVFIILSQRPGPATGLPTRTGQEDLEFAVHAGHGEFARAVYAPGTIAQSIEITRLALETAHEFQTPSIMLTDQFITDLQQGVELPSGNPSFIDRRIADGAGADYVRYEITESGISPRAIPGGDAFVVVDSDEHTADGHLTEDIAVRQVMQEKRMRKFAGLTARALPPEIYPSPAGEILLCWGSTYGPCREAVDSLRAAGRDVCLAHFPQVWPLDGAALRKVFDGRRVTSVEGNAGAQFAHLLRRAGALTEFSSISRFDGLPFNAEYILEKYNAGGKR